MRLNISTLRSQWTTNKSISSPDEFNPFNKVCQIIVTDIVAHDFEHPVYMHSYVVFRTIMSDVICENHFFACIYKKFPVFHVLFTLLRWHCVRVSHLLIEFCINDVHTFGVYLPILRCMHMYNMNIIVMQYAGKAATTRKITGKW